MLTLPGISLVYPVREAPGALQKKSYEPGLRSQNVSVGFGRGGRYRAMLLQLCWSSQMGLTIGGSWRPECDVMDVDRRRVYGGIPGATQGIRRSAEPPQAGLLL